MKKIILLAIVFLGLGVSAQAQQAVSAAITNQFNELYTDAEEVEWEENEKGQFVAYFITNGSYAQATFTEDAKWVTTSIFVGEEGLTEAMKKGIEKAITGEFYYTDVEKVLTSSSVLYKVELENDDEMISLVLDKDGKITKKDIQKF